MAEFEAVVTEGAAFLCILSFSVKRKYKFFDSFMLIKVWFSPIGKMTECVHEA